MSVRHLGEAALAHSFGRIKEGIAEVPRPYDIAVRISGVNPFAAVVCTTENGFGSKSAAVLLAEIEAALLRGDLLRLKSDVEEGAMSIPLLLINPEILIFETIYGMESASIFVVGLNRSDLTLSGARIHIPGPLTIDDYPVIGSYNPVRSNGVAYAISQVPKPYCLLATATGVNPFTGVVNSTENGLGTKTVATLKSELAAALTRGDDLIVTLALSGVGDVRLPLNCVNSHSFLFETTGDIGDGLSRFRVRVNRDTLALDVAVMTLQEGLSFDDEPTYSSGNPVTSGGVYDALDGVLEAAKDYTDGVALSGLPEDIRRVLYIDAVVLGTDEIRVVVLSTENFGTKTVTAIQLAIQEALDRKDLIMLRIGIGQNIIVAPCTMAGELLTFVVHVDLGQGEMLVRCVLDAENDLAVETTVLEVLSALPEGVKPVYTIDAALTGANPYTAELKTVENGLGDKTEAELQAELMAAIDAGDTLMMRIDWDETLLLPMQVQVGYVVGFGGAVTGDGLTNGITVLVDAEIPECVVYKAGLIDYESLDNVPRYGSESPVTSDGVFSALGGKSDIGHTHDRVNGYKLVVSGAAPTENDPTVLTFVV